MVDADAEGFRSIYRGGEDVKSLCTFVVLHSP